MLLDVLFQRLKSFLMMADADIIPLLIT